MTAAQIKKLETIIGKLESLQCGVKSHRLSGLLGEAKSILIKADLEALR